MDYIIDWQIIDWQIIDYKLKFVDFRLNLKRFKYKIEVLDCFKKIELNYLSFNNIQIFSFSNDLIEIFFGFLN